MVSDDELEAEYQETVALKTFVKQRRAGKPQSPGDHKVELDKLEQKLPCAQGGRLGHGKDGHHCLAKVKRVSWAGGSNKLGGELCTVGCVFQFRNLTNLKPSSESFSYNLGLENSTCIADMFLYVPNLDGSVVSDCGDTRHVLGVGDTQPMLFCWSECSRSGTQPVRTPLALSAPNIDSVVNVCIYRAEEGCCVVSVAQGPPIEGGQSVWICMTNNSLIDDGFTAGEPRVCADLSLRVSIRSEFDGSESIADTYDSDGLAFQQEGTATCTKGYEATSRITVPTTRTCHFDDYTSADTGWQFPMGVTTTWSQCSDSTDAPDHTNSTVGGTCVVSCSGC